MTTPADRYQARAGQILTEIKLSGRLHGYPPSRRELAELLQTSTSVINWYLTRLERDGLIEWDRKTARGIRIKRNGR